MYLWKANSVSAIAIIDKDKAVKVVIRTNKVLLSCTSAVDVRPYRFYVYCAVEVLEHVFMIHGNIVVCRLNSNDYIRFIIVD